MTLTVSDRSGATDPTPAKRTITVTNNPGVPTGSASFANWISEFSVDGQTAPNGDFDHDGLGNAVENILGTNPAVPSAGLAIVAETANALTFRHTRSTSPAEDIVPAYEWSTDMIHWHPDGGSSAGLTVSFGTPAVIHTGSPETIHVTATASGGTTTNLFVRLKASAP